MAAPEVADAIRLWRHLSGGRPDLIALFTGLRVEGKRDLSMPAERFYRPAELDQALAWARQQDGINRETYCSAHQLLAPRRVKDNAAPVLALWCESDGADVSGSPIKPTALVESSPGHFHCYARLSRPVTPFKAEQLNKRWARSFGADGSGFDLTQLLRVPGTHNHKYPGAPEVKLLYIDEEMVYDLEEVDRILPPLPDPPAVTTTPSAALSDDDAELVALLMANNPVFGRLWQGNTSDYTDEHGHVDGSDAEWGLLQDLLRGTGCDAERTERLARQSGLVKLRADRWNERRGDKSFLRYSIDRAIENPSEALRAPLLLSVSLHPSADPTTWPKHTAPEPGPLNGTCSAHCTAHLKRIRELEQQAQELREQNALRAALFRRPKEELKPADKLVGQALLNLQASLESRGETGRIPVVIEAEPQPEREQWINTSLTAVVGMSDSTVRRSLERLAPTTGGGLWEREYEPYVTSEGLQRSRLVLKPADNRPAAEQWKTILTFTPPDEDKPPPRRELIRCKRHPFVKVNKETTWRCTVCGRHAKEPRSETLDPCEVEPPAIQNDRLVNGFAEPGQVPGRDIWAASPAIQNEGLGKPEPLVLPVDGVNALQNEGLAAEAAAARDASPRSLNYWPVYDRAPIQPVVVDLPSAEAEDPPRGEHACEDCGAFGDEQWGEVVLIGPPGKQIWLHAGMDAPCHAHLALVGGAA